MTSPNRLHALCSNVCAVLTEIAPATPHEHRLAATALVLTRLVDAKPWVMAVRSVAYNRLAAQRLGGAFIPQHQGEVDHFREQVGPGMVFVNDSQPYGVLILGDLMIDVTDARDWNDRGVLARPFATRVPVFGESWSIGGLRYGVVMAYEIQPHLQLELCTDLAVGVLAQRIEESLLPEALTGS